MGWTGIPGATRADIIRDVLQPSTNSEGLTWTHVEHALKGNVLWSIVEVRDAAGALNRQYIQCTLIEGSAYKEMSCCMGPYYDSCPPAYLDKVPAHDQTYCASWRARVRAKKARA